MVNFNCVTGAPMCGQPFCPCICCPCCLGDSFLSEPSGITVTHVSAPASPAPLTLAERTRGYCAQYDALVGKLAPCAIPFLVSLGPCFQPCYSCADATGCCCVASDPQRPSASSKPLVIFASRTVKDLAAYKTAFAAYAEAAMKAPGVRACFSFPDKEKANTVLQLTWIDSAADLPAASSKLVSCYAGSAATDFCIVWGKWDQGLKAKMSKDAKCRCSAHLVLLHRCHRPHHQHCHRPHLCLHQPPPPPHPPHDRPLPRCAAGTHGSRRRAAWSKVPSARPHHTPSLCLPAPSEGSGRACAPRRAA